MGLIFAIGVAHAKTQADMEREIASLTATEIRAGSTPQQISAFLKAHDFYPTEYTHE